ncbi:predicted protein [Uncinocarpus reesii 1704]|uniref:Uncharacterized protein n=1 Tax=Uncinocarpus reesii (strain UAMH 1704) TaxID=336963 RepID=C4JZH7_UNCRE|nr:uncharacterized protein UREG_07578 [Uncinocarpus reesii 1704]EEP82713.1 predicted protein [Uncinocarpus reesii 1704]
MSTPGEDMPTVIEEARMRVDAAGVYVLVFNMGFTDRFHWGLFVAEGDTDGFLHHYTDKSPTGDWEYQVISPYNVQNSLSLLTALKIGKLDDMRNEFLTVVHERLKDVKVDGVQSCRKWLLEAIYLLANEGYLGIQPDRNKINFIEYEAKDAAMRAMQARKPSVEKSRSSAA